MNVSLQVALRSLERIARQALALLPSLAIGAVVFALFLGLSRLARRAARGVAHRASGDDVLAQLAGRLAASGTVLAGFLLACVLVFPSVRPRDLLSGLGITSVAVGFAFKDILQNFLAGVLIMLRKPFRVGDQIVTAGFEGTVEAIDVRATRLRTYAGERVVVPNATVFTSAVTVRTAYGARRSELAVGIGYRDDVERARGAIVEALAGIDEVRDDPPVEVHVAELAPSAVNLRVRFWTAPDIASVTRAGDRVATAIKTALDAAGVDMPYPQVVVHGSAAAPVRVALAGDPPRDADDE